MRNLFPILFFGLFLLFFLSHCANPRPLVGGKKDETPPKLDSNSYSTPNKSLNFKDKEIILTFDEWVQLDQNKILISPPMAQKPDFKIKHKSLVIKFKDTLRENTTYTINLSDGIKDYTENNMVKNMKFVFSTGDFLDSLQIKGQIIDALTSQPKNNILIMLYNSLQDSVPCLQKPLYLARTDEQGMFSIENVKSDSFKIFALSDKNNNLLFDQANEEIAFIPNNFLLTDSSQPTLKMRLFAPQALAKVQNSKFIHQNLIRVGFNQNILQKIDIQPISDNFKILKTEQSGDSALIFIQQQAKNADKLSFIIKYANQDRIDTASLTFSSTLDTLPKIKFAEAAKNKAAKTAKNAEPKQNPANSHQLIFNLPITEWDSSRILLYQDTNKISASFSLKQTAERVFNLQTSWQSVDYQLVILPNALKNCYGENNQDTIIKKISVAKLEEFGNLKLKIVNIDSIKSENYLLQLIRDKTDVVVEKKFNSQNKSSMELDFSNLETGSYFVRIITDSNLNGRWDTGDYWQKTQPESVFNSNSVSIRANWDNELQIDFNPPAKGKKQK